MTAIERYDAQRDTLATPDVLNTAMKLATQICATEFVPKGLRGSPEKVLAALLLGREKGIGAMTALGHIDVIEGKAVCNSALNQALAESSGARFKVRESSAARCVIHAWGPGDTGEPTEVTWTIDDAKQAGLTGKDNWRKYPKRMLFRRAMADAAAMVAAAAIVGLPITVEEYEDDAYQTANMAPEATASRTVARRKPAAPQPAPQAAPAAPMPSFDDDDVTDAELVDPPTPTRTVNHTWDRPADDQEEQAALPIEDGEAATTKQINKMSIEFNRLGWDEAAIDAYVLSMTDGRTDSRKAMTKTEASKAIDELVGL